MSATTTAARIRASSSKGYRGWGTATTRIPAAAADRTPFDESSTATHPAGSTPSRSATARYTSGIACHHVLHHLGADLLRRASYAQLLAHVPGPLAGAHTHFPALRVRPP